MSPNQAQMSYAPAGQFMASVADEVTRETVRSVATQLGWQNQKFSDGGPEGALSVIRTSIPPAVLVVDICDSDDALGAIRGIMALCGSDTKVIAIGLVNDVSFYRRLIETGVSDYLVKPVSGQMLSQSIQNATRSESRAPLAAKVARTIALIGARGGVGTTSLAVSSAWTMTEERNLRVVLLDLDLHFGSLALSLDVEPGRGLREILANPDRVDSLLIRSAMANAGERLRILAAEEPLEESVDLGNSGLDALITDLGGSTDCIVIDTPRSLGGLTRHVLAVADQIGVVSEQSLASMRDTQRLLAFIKGQRGDAKVVVIANRVGGIAGEVSPADFERGIGAKIDFSIPFDGKAAAAAAERAKALANVSRDGKTTAELRKLAGFLSGTDATAKTSLFKRLLRK